MNLVIHLTREDLIAALKATEGTAPKGVALGLTTDVAPKTKKPKEEKPAKEEKKKPKKEEPAAEEEFDETEEAEEEAEEESEEAEEGEDASEEASDEEEYVVGEDLAKLKKALNAHKAANGGKPKKTLEILRKYSPGGSEKVKPDVLPKLLKALKV